MTHKLDLSFKGKGEVKGFFFTQKQETNDGYVYQVDTGSKVHFEYFLKKSRAVCIDFKNRIYSETEFKEVYPKSKAFGNWAWGAPSFEDAASRLALKASERKAKK